MKAWYDLVRAVDVSPADKFLSAAEIDPVTVRALGWSWGAIAAVNLSRTLAPERGRMREYRFEKPIPVETFVAIDPVYGKIPRKIKWAWGPIKSNVNEFYNYYQGSDQPSAIAWYVPSSNIALGADTFEGFVFPGNPLRANSVVPPVQIPIDTNTSYRNLELSDTYVSKRGDFWQDARMMGMQVNHTTIVWYVQDLVRQVMGV